MLLFTPWLLDNFTLESRSRTPQVDYTLWDDGQPSGSVENNCTIINRRSLYSLSKLSFRCWRAIKDSDQNLQNITWVLGSRGSPLANLSRIPGISF
ncbi:hypothetical protein ElyMa_001304500 [Elysia marginata]|uniref:Uncharacterized protein n=1 Tax=Elysia marginata TaxID=1093978 RepID=A0AAV4IIG0_9GAST|nr:hypothetical protein ElyMa_001304500 [Elysia marginata]